ncbi:hypothetical protein A3770_01p00110 [Chloropicon primus]|uniref:Tyrosine-protein kinase ephrin type A/B receptor-like domain-containing protein n=1 Tax=Chloropicon primus TaxID=1764295 RepID=A0A5B8MAV7_9CHLO|nr:hypothetical protein A3770_01p00110 [Chloropicon primus]|eukprot:QDZ17493.1 hypothetical protein A3770_01p00110 [Chloropicon primus]
MSVKGILPRAVDKKEGGEVLVWGQGFQEGLRCSVGGGAAGESYAQVLNESCALCSIPRGVEEDGSPDQYTSIDLYYNPLCRNKIEVYRYDRPKVLSAETLGASRYSEIVVLLELERAEVDRLVRMPELTPSCRLRSTRAGDLFEMAAEIVQANSTVRCSVGDDRIVEGSYELSFSVNDVQYGFFGHTVRVRSAEMWIESVHFDGASDDVVAKVRIEGSFSSEEVFAQMQLTLTTLATGREQKVLYPLSWDGQGREKVVRIKLPESMRPTLFSTLDLSISRSEGVSIRVEGPKVLWNPATIIEGFALESQCILNSREQESASVKVMAPGHAQFEAAGLVLKTSGGSAIPAYHYRVSQVTQTLVKGNDSCVAGDSGLGLVEQACGVELDVEVFWHNIKPADFLTIGVELSYQQNHEVLRVAFPNAIQLWGLSEDSGSCPSGFSEEGLVGPEEALDYTAFGFGLARKELEALSMYPPYNPTVRKYSALTFEDKVWIHSPLNWKNSGGMDLRLTFQAYENAVTVDFPRPNWFMIPLNLKEGENKATLSITSPTNQAATFDLDVYRSDPSNYIKSMTLQTRHENKTLCAHNSTRDYPLCIPGSHLFQQVTMSEAIYLEVESNATLTSPFIVGHNATENGLTRYALSHKLLEEHTFSIGHDMVLNSKQRISITIDWKAEGGHNFLVNKVYDRPEPVDPNDNGFQLQAAFPACEVCPSGYFSGKINSTFCEPCRAGYFSGSPGRGICESCKPGYYSMDYANEKCDPCLRGLYMPKPGGKECFECPKNATTSARGSMSCTLIEEKEKWLPTIVVEFSVTVNATNLSDVGKKFGVQDISDERAIEVLMKDDTATAFSSTAHNVSVSDVNVWVTELEHGLIQAKINVTLVPNITLKSSEKERAEAMKQLSDISADKGINLLADNPDQFFGRTLEAINGTSTVENILQRQTPYSRRGKKDLLAVHWIISVSIFTGFSCVLFTKRVRKRCYKRASKGKVERERRHRKTKSMGALRMVI